MREVPSVVPMEIPGAPIPKHGNLVGNIGNLWLHVHHGDVVLRERSAIYDERAACHR